MFGRNFWWHRPPQMRENEFSVVTESFLTGGTASVEVGSSFTYQGSDATLSVRDNDRKMAGDVWRNERGVDTQPGTLTTHSGDTVDAGNIYAERYLILRGSDGKWYTMIEIEGTNLSNDPAQDDVFAFYGAVPAPGVDLTVHCAGNVWFGVKYDALNGGPAAIVLEAVDDAFSVAMDTLTTANLLANDIGDNAVIASFADTSIDTSGGPVVIEVDGIVFTISADGQISIDPQSAASGIALLDGETLDITLSYTITDGMNTSEAELTLTLEGVNDAPELAGLSPVLDNFTLQEQQDGEIYSVDLNAYFSDPDGDALTLTSDNLPAGFQIVNGVLGLDGTAIAHGEHTITVTATDTSGASVNTDLSFIAALNLSSNDKFSNQDIVLDGTEIADSVEYTARDAFDFGSLNLDLKGGDDVFRTRGGTFGREGTVDIDTGAGNDTVVMGSGPGDTFGRFTLQTGIGDDTVTLGNYAAGNEGVMVVETDTGADTITFARNVARSHGSLTVNAGADDDNITFGEFAAADSGAVAVNAGADDDTITFGEFAAAGYGAVTVDAGTGADMISFASFGNRAELRYAGTVTIDLGDDKDRDVLSFENLGNVTVWNWTQGEDAAITVADPTLYIAREENGNTIFENANGRQTMVVEGVTGVPFGEILEGYNYAPTVTGPIAIADAVSEDDGPLQVDLLDGATDPDGDTLSVTDVVATYVDSTGGTVPVTVNVDATGVATFDPAQFNQLGEGDSAEFTITFDVTDPSGRSVSNTATVTVTGSNDGPVFVGADTALDDFTLQDQQAGAGYSVDLGALFSDPEGDAFTLTSGNLPAGFEIVNGVLGLDGTEFAHGDHTITVTATDTSGASISTDLTFIAALNLNSDDQFFGATVDLDGTEIADSVEYAGGAFLGGSLNLDLKGGNDVFRTGDQSLGYGATSDIDMGAGNDTVELGNFTAAYIGAMLTLHTGSGDDNVTVGDRAASEGSAMVIETDTGADTVTFGRNAAGSGGSLTVDAGADDDTITFGELAAASGGAVTVDAGSGADMISFASFGTGSVGTITIDLGDDTDRDVLIFENLGNVTVQNWTQGEDAAILVDDPNLYSARSENGNTIFESADGLQSLVIEGLTGLTVTDVFDFG